MSTSYATGDVVAGKYRLERRLASGGMGQVWAARHVDLDTLFAVKFIDPSVDDREAMRNRFVREAKTAAKVRSPHIVTIHDFGTDGDVMYIAMELLEGEDLGTRLTRQKRLSVDMAARIVRDAARGLGRAHEAGIVHRDLKPRNLFMARDGDQEIVKLLDFGVAKASWAEGGDTKTGEIVGSPHYMSPEQVHGSKEVDHRADLWSLAVILFRAITGKRPFKGQGVGEVIVEISTSPRRVASELVPGLPRGLDGFFDRALARDPNDRFQSAAELATELAFVTGTADTLADISFPRAPASVRSSPSDTAVMPQLAAQDEDAPTLVHTPSIEEIAAAAPRSGPPEDGAAPRAPIEPEPPSERPAADTSPSASSYGSLASLQQSLDAPPPPPNRGAFVAVGVAGLIAVAVIAGIMASAPATDNESSTPVDAPAQAGGPKERTEEAREEAGDTPDQSATAVDPEPAPTVSANAEKKPKTRAGAGPRPQAPPATPKPKSDEERRRLGY